MWFLLLNQIEIHLIGVILIHGLWFLFLQGLGIIGGKNWFFDKFESLKGEEIWLNFNLTPFRGKFFFSFLNFSFRGKFHSLLLPKNLVLSGLFVTLEKIFDLVPLELLLFLHFGDFYTLLDIFNLSIL